MEPILIKLGAVLVHLYCQVLLFWFSMIHFKGMGELYEYYCVCVCSVHFILRAYIHFWVYICTQTCWTSDPKWFHHALCREPCR
jgi:hypothetical protein